MKDIIVGIDLGTTNSELAVVTEGNLQVVPIHGKPILPSCVGLDPQGNLLVGQSARNQMVVSPEETVLSIKRKMGESVKVPLGPREYSPEEISALILRELKKESERYLDRSVSKAVITVPAYFDEARRKATQTAGLLAGLEVVRILNEPTAAALAYGAGTRDSETLLVYDLGGGTFDVSVVVVEAGVVEVKASHGDTRLGGDDFDQLLVEHARAEFRKMHGKELPATPQILYRLKEVLEKAKCRLSNEPYVMIREEYIDGKNHLELEIRRDDYERMILPLVEKTLHCVHQSLADARLGPRDIDKVMLVGGATRTPLVQQLLRERMQADPHFEIDPELIVAMGAAIQAGVLAGEKQHTVLVDITPHTLSTGAIDGDGFYPRLVCVPIVPRNTPLPAGKAEIFFTSYPNQTEVAVTVYQGESSQPEENRLIGDFLVEGLSRAPEGNPILIHFALDLNGMLKVTATEKNTGLSRSVVLDTHGAEVLDFKTAQRNLHSLLQGGLSHPLPDGAEEDIGAIDDRTDRREVLAAAKDLRRRGEALLLKTLGESDAEEIRRHLQESLQAIEKREWDRLQEINDTLSDLLFYLED